MFKRSNQPPFKYTPILSIRNSEMTALQQLPEKSKDILLPLISLRGWVSSKKLEKSILQIKKSFGDRFWIADIDKSFLEVERNSEGEYPREVFQEIENLLISNNGYENWVEYVNNIPNIIPTVQLGDINQISTQMTNLAALGRGIVLRFKDEDIESSNYQIALNVAANLGLDDVYVIFDYGQVTREILTYYSGIASLVQAAHKILNDPLVSISASSFPYSFSGFNKSEYSIYERLLFNKVTQECKDIRLLYSDWGSARADRIEGGGGIPSPRIDYPLQNEWRSIREEFEDYANPAEGEKDRLYTKIAQELIKESYWITDLHVWGTQMIELTSIGDSFGINNPMKATAVRINLHLHQQLYYDSPIELIDTDEEWKD